MKKFPVLKKRRKGVKSILKEEIINIYCTCHLPDDKTGMVCCDNCEEWFIFIVLASLQIKIFKRNGIALTV